MIYKVKIYSGNVLSGGDWRSGEYNLGLKEHIPNNYQICVESFDITKTANNYVPICVGIQNLSQQNTNNTSTQSQMSNLFSTTLASFNNEITSKSIGFPLNNSSQFQNKIKVTVTLIDNSLSSLTYFTGSAQWTMLLCIMPIPVSLLN